MAHLATFGNAYVGKFREDGEVTQLGLLDPDRVRPELEGGRLRYRYTPGNGPQRMLTQSDLVHIRGLSVDGLVGLSAAPTKSPSFVASGMAEHATSAGWADESIHGALRRGRSGGDTGAGRSHQLSEAYTYIVPPMGCFIALLALFSPRLALVAIWLFSDLLSRAFDSWLLPLVGFFLLPWTTLAYAVMWSTGTNEVSGFEWFIVVLAFLLDLGSYANGRRSRAAYA